MDIIIFKTSVNSPDEVSRVNNLLTAVPGIQQWNFDLDDCDNILRIVAKKLYPPAIESLLQMAGVDCQELKY